MTVEEIRLEALRLASSCGTPPEEVVKAAGLFAAFLEGKSPSSDAPNAGEKTKANAGKVDRAPSATDAKAADSSKAVETKVADSSKPVETKADPETVDAKVARLAKELLTKSRPKLISALKELGVERARDLKTPESLAAAVPVLEKALKDAA